MSRGGRPCEQGHSVDAFLSVFSFFLFVAKLAMDERARVQCVAFECARSVELSRQLCMFVYIFDTLFWTPWQLLPVEEKAENRTEPKNMTRTLPCAPYVNTR